MKKTAWSLVLTLLFSTVLIATGLLWGGLTAYAAGDGTPPVNEVGYPYVRNVGTTSLDLFLKTDEAGTAYYKICDAGAPAPGAAEVKVAGVDFSLPGPEEPARAYAGKFSPGTTYGFSGLAVDAEGNIYTVKVSSPYDIRKYDRDGNLLGSWPSGSYSAGCGPRSIAVDGDGYIYVGCPTAADNIRKFHVDSNNNLIQDAAWTVPQNGSGLIALDNSGFIYSAFYDNVYPFLYKLNTADGTYTQMDFTGSGAVQNLAVDDNNNLYVALLNGWSVTIRKYDQDGNLLLSGIGAGRLHNGQSPRQMLAVDRNKNIYVDSNITDVTSAGYGVQIFDRDGNYRGKLDGYAADGVGRLQHAAWGMTTDADGNFYLYDCTNIWQFAAGGKASITSGLEQGRSYDIYVAAEDADGNLQAAPTKLSITMNAETAAYPVFAKGYPRTADVKAGSLDLQVKMSKTGSFYYKVLTRGASAPTSADLKAGGTQVAAEADTVTTAHITGLHNGMAYDIYVAAEDSGGNLQPAPALVRVTPGEAGFEQGYPRAENVTATGVDLLLKASEPGTAYYKVYDVVPQALPSAEDVASTGTQVEVQAAGITWGGSGSGDGQFNNPHGVAEDGNGNIYVADTGNHRIQKFDASGNFITKWGSRGSGDGQFESPWGVAVDENGHVWVTDAANHTVQEFDAGGNFISRRGSIGTGYGTTLNEDTASNNAVEFTGPKGLAINMNGGANTPIIAADAGNHRLQEFQRSASPQTWVNWGGPGSGGTVGGAGQQYNNPMGVAMDASGNIYVADRDNDRVQKVAAGSGTGTGSVYSMWGGQGSGDGQFMSPTGVAVDEDGSVYVTDTRNHRVQIFNSDGNFLVAYGTEGSDNLQFQAPTGIAVDADKNIYVADAVNNRIQKILRPQASAGVSLDMTAGKAYVIYAVFQDDEGNLQEAATRLDAAAPVFDTGYPKASSVTGNSLDLTVRMDEGGTVYYQVRDHGAAAPDSAELKSSGTTAALDESFLAKWGANGSGDGQFNRLFDVAVDADGNVYVADNNNNRIQKFGKDGNFITKWGSEGTGDGQFSFPYGVAVDQEGNVYVADTYNNRIQKFDGSGNFLGWYGKGTSATGWHGPGSGETGVSGSGDGEFNCPWDVAIDRHGDIYVTDYYNYRIQKFDGSGNFLGWYGKGTSTTGWHAPGSGETGVSGSGDGEFTSALGIAVDGEDNVYVTSSSRVQKFGRWGSFITRWGGSGSGDGQFNMAVGIDVDKDGHVYVADSNNQRVQKFDGDGNFLGKFGSYGTGDGQFRRYPYGVAAANDGHIYVVTQDYDCRVHKFGFAKTVSITEGLEPGHTYDIYLTAEDAGGRLQPAPTKVTVTMDEAAAIASGYPQTANVRNTSLDLTIKTNKAGTAYYKAYAGGAAAPTSAELRSTGTPVTIAEKFAALWGSSGSGEGQFNMPFGAAADADGNVYAADTMNHRVQKFDSSGALLGWFGKGSSTTGWHGPGSGETGASGSGDGEFNRPFSVAADGGGNIYVADTMNNRIQKFDSSGNYLAQWGGAGSGDGQFNSPVGITVDGDGNVYVTDRENKRVQKFDGSGNYITQWGTEGTGDGQFKGPIGIVADQNGNVYVSDEMNNRVQKFDRNGNFLLKWGKTDCSSGSGDGEFDAPEGMAIDSDGYIYVVESGNNRVQKFDGSGSFIAKWGGSGSGDGQFSNPYGIAVGDGGVYIADTANSRVQQYAFMETVSISEGLADGQTYDIYAAAESVGGILQSAPVKVTVTMDTAPVFDSGYPQAANVQNTSLDLLLKQDEAGTAYYKVYDAGTANPASADLKAEGTAVAIAGTEEVSESITGGLTEGQTYDIFVAAENGNGSLQVIPAKVTVTMAGTASGAHIASTVPTSLAEAAANDGSLDPNTVVVTIADGTLAADIARADVTAAHLPSGLDYTVTRDSDTQLTIAVTGQAANNTIADNVNNLTFTIARAKVTGAEGSLTSANIGISFKGPAAPTNPVVNDGSDTFGWTWTTGYETAAQYEYSVNGGAAWNDCTANPQPVGNHHYGAGTVRVRVKAGSAADGYAGGALANNQAFTKAPVFDGGYPQTSNVTETGLNLTVKMDEAGAAYYKVYSHGADAPSAAEVKAGGTSLAVGIGYVSQWGGSGSGNGQFNTPNMVAVDQAGNIYVADDVNNRVQKFDGSGNWLAQIGSSGSGDGQFQNVNGVAVDADGNVYVTDWSLNRVQKFNSSGTFLTKWGGSGSGNGQFSYPYGVAVDAAGNVYVADSHNNRIQKFDGSGNFLLKWGSNGSGDGQFNLPVGVAVDSTGNVYVADCDNNRVQKFDGSGNYLAKWGGSGTGDGQFAKPQGIAADHCGNIYVADLDNKRVQKFSGSGTFISKWGGAGSGDGQFDGPYGAAVDSAGNIYVSDRPNTRIEKFSYINTASLTGLTGGQTYDLYVVAESSGGGLQAAPTKLEVTMSGTAASIASTVPTALTEAAANDGSLTTGTVVITIANGTLAADIAKADVTAANLPAGLDYVVTRTDDTHLTVNITGTATNHANANDVGNLTFTIAQAKVTGATGDLTTENISIDFDDPAGSDTAAPAVADGTITTSGLTYNGVTLSWTKATDDISAQGALQYLVYRSDSADIDTVTNAVYNGTAVGDYATDIDTKEVTGLTANTTYYFNVIVKDEAGNKSAYTMREVTTEETPAGPSAKRGAGVTIIIHGWQPEEGEPSWTAAMQDDIVQRLGGEGRTGKITVTGTKGNLTAACDPWNIDLESSNSGEVVVRVDWSAVANHLVAGVTAQEAAAAIAPKIYQGQNGQPPLSELPIHLIGHSRGGGMVYELARLLGERGIEVDQVTSLDPHPLTSSDAQGFPATIDTPIGGVPENVLFADNYWQNITYPKGEYVDGAYNREWTGLPGGYHNHGNTAYSTVADHLNIHLLYEGTVSVASAVYDGQATLGSAERSSWFNSYEDSGAKTGFYYSGIGGGDRKSADAPVSGGDQVIDGYNGDSLLGGAGSRQPLNWASAVWPNVITLDILRDGQSIGTGTQTVTPGEALDLKYTYRDYDGSCDITFYADQDRNPYNNNNLAAIATQSHTATGSNITQAAAAWNVTELSPTENYYVYAKITDSSGTRYLYAAPELQESAAVNKVATPAADPPAGEVAGGTQVTLTCATAGADIYYTTDGSDPTVSGAVYYSGPITIIADTTVKAFAVKAGMDDSDIMTAAYTITPAGPAASIASTVPASLTEAAANDGSLTSGTVVITIANGTLAADIAKADVIAANLPAGLDYTVTRTDDTHLTINITGNAANHANANDVSNLTFTIAQAKVTGATGDLTTENLSIDFNNPDSPAAPTNPLADDANNTFGWTNVTGFDNVTDYEYTKDGGTTWNTCDANPQTGFDGDIVADQVRVRVKADASSGRPAGAALQATEAFTANQTYSGGNGTEGDPYQITTVTDLELVGADAANGVTGGKYYKLMNNIDLGGVANWSPIGADASHPFRGHFDGGGYTISHLSIGTEESPDTALDYLGLFGYTDGAAIHHLNLEDAAIHSSKQFAKIGGLAGYANGGTVEYCSATGSVSGGEDAAAGGLAGYIDGATVRDSHTNVSVEVKNAEDVASDYIYAGGLAGYSHQGTIERSYATGSAEAGYFGSGTGWVNHYYVGGLVGYNDGGVIKNSYSSGTVLGGQGPNAADRANIGGLAGAHNNGGSIINCYATGNVGIVSGAIWYTGGLTGENNGGSIQNSYASCRITPSSLYDNGGLIGHYFGGAITNSYWDSDIGTATRGIGRNETGTDTTIAKTSAEMQSSGFFRLLNKNRGSNVRWKIIPGVNGSYPVLLNIGQGVDRSGYTDWYYNDPDAAEFTVSNAAELAYFAELVNTVTDFSGKTVNLAADIDLSVDIHSEEWQPIGESFGSPFKGTFDGHGHAISNLKIGASDSPDTSLNFAGLFGYFDGTAIRNVDVDAAIYSSWGYGYIGGLVGRNNGGVIENCHMTGSVTGGGDNAYTGGLIGYNSGTIENCHMTGSVTGSGDNAYAGGLIGYNSGTIENCHAAGNVMAGGGSTNPGGLVGFNSGVIHNSYATGSVAVGNNAFAGGLVGHNIGTIEESYATGDTTAGSNTQSGAGGLVGYNNTGTIRKSHATGDVTVGDDTGRDLYAGGLVGWANDSTIEDSYAEGNVTGGNGVRAGGLVGFLLSGYSITNCYARGNVTGGNNAYVGGLAGYFQGTLTNCYSTGDAAGGSGSYVGGLLGRRSGGTVTYGYWNSDAAQTVNGAAQTPKKGVGYGTDASTAKTSGEMQSEAFVTLLNDNRGEYAQWMFVPGQNDGYPVLSLAEPDTTAPIVADGTITTSDLTETGVTLSWNKATDDVTTQGALQYLVYRSDSNNIDTVESIEANGTAIGTYATDINTKEITGLTGDTTYYFNVLVKDEAGNKSAYTMQEVTTTAPSPVIQNVVLNPTTHVAGTAQDIQVAIFTTNVVDGTQTVVSFVYGQGDPLVPEIIQSGMINNNTAVLTLTINGNVAAGSYKVKVEVDGIADASLNDYVISEPGQAAFIASTTPTALSEAAANDGSLNPNTVVITIANGTLAADIAKSDVTAANLPAGLDYTVTRTDATHLTISITGNAANHANADDISNLHFTIAQTKVTGAESDLITANISINFNDPAAPAASIASTLPTSLTEAAANDGSLTSGTVVITIANGTLAADIAKADVTAANLPAGLDYTVTRTDATHLTINITGNATNHANADDVSNLRFTVAQAKVTGAESDLTTSNISINFNDPAGPVTCTVTIAASEHGTATGGGTYTQGQSITLSATPNAGYNFSGWYEGATKVSSLPNYSFTAERDITLTPSFAAMEKGFLEVTTVGDGSVILNGTINCNGNYKDEHVKGTSIQLTATANAGYAFAYWEDVRTASVISTDPVYDCTMGTGVNVKAVFNRIPTADTTEFTVIFKDKSGKILKSTSVVKNSAATPPANAPALAGYTFTGWDKDYSNVTSDMTVNAKYERMPDTYTVTVVGGTLSTGGTTGNYQYDMPVTVVAGAAPEGLKFSHWTQDGKKVSTKSAFSFFTPMKDTVLTAVFVDESAEIVNVPFITLSEDVQVDTANNTMLFTAIRDVPDGYTLVESGVLLLQSNTPLAGELTVDTEGAIRGKIKNDSTDQFYIRKSNITAGDTWHARAYLIYRDSAGNIVTVYSDNTVNRTME